MKTETITCDVCGTEKGQEGRDWYSVQVLQTGFMVSTPRPDGSGHDCCGEACVTKMLSRYLHGEPVTGKEKAK